MTSHFYLVKDSVKSGVFYRYLFFTLSADIWKKKFALLGAMVVAVHSFISFSDVV